MKLCAIIQARINSVRLPAKVLLDLEGKTVLERVVERVRAGKFIDEVVVATGSETDNFAIVELCQRSGINIFCGSENDVLDRFYQAALKYKAGQIIRVTADCPLIDPAVIDDVINLHLKEEADYSSNAIKESYPDGEDVEIMTLAALKNAWENACLRSQREHVTVYIRNNPSIFKICNLENEQNLSDKRWTLDEHRDYDFIKNIYKFLYQQNRLFGMKEILALLCRRPELELINRGIERNEGYCKSLKNDYKVK